MTYRRWIRAKRHDAWQLRALSLKATDPNATSRKSRKYSWLRRALFALSTYLEVLLAPGRIFVFWKDDEPVAMIAHQSRLLLMPSLWCQYSKLRGGVCLYNLYSTNRVGIPGETIANLLDAIDDSGQRSFIVKPDTAKLEINYTRIFGSKRWKNCSNRTITVLEPKHQKNRRR